MLLTAQGCARLRTGPIIMQIPRGYQKKNLLCRKARYVRSLGIKPHLWPSQRLRKRTGTVSCMHKGPKCIQSLWDHPKKIPFVQKHKEGAICAILREKTPFLAFQRLKKQTGTLSCLHKGPKCIQSLCDHPKIIPFVQKHKEGAICAILRKKIPFWGIRRG